MNTLTGTEVGHLFMEKVGRPMNSQDCSGTWLDREPNSNTGTWAWGLGFLDFDYLISYCVVVHQQQEEEPRFTTDYLFVWFEHSTMSVEWWVPPTLPFGDTPDQYDVLRSWMSWTECMHEMYSENLKKRGAQ